jgi:aminoglycoside/choline kinase family phosphotransferase
MSNSHKKQLAQLFEEWAGEEADLILPLAPSGGNRIYYRLQGKNKSAIGTYGSDAKENKAFVSFTKLWNSKGLPVPQLFAEDLDHNIYLQEDLGSTTLYSFLLQKDQGFPPNLMTMYKRVVQQLARVQIEGAKGLDYDSCYPRSAFDQQSMFWDCNTFKYYFLKLAGFIFDEQALEDDFRTFANYLLQADCSHFMLRDFQSRNIMMRNGEPFFIDYQGGRRGALQYDLASLLYQAKAAIPPEKRLELLDHYLEVAGQLTDIDRESFIEFYYGYALMRSIQTFGTYGYRGLFERKEHFMNSIPFAVNNIRWFVKNVELKVKVPELWRILEEIAASDQFDPFDTEVGNNSLLTVKVCSFSYKSGIPPDSSGNGGGFVFDCRGIHNPGRYEPYKKLTGRDKPVINFLKSYSNIDSFLNNIYTIVDPVVENYIERSFTNLAINFGCTGGQHRSVYSADAISRHLKQKFGIKVQLEHIEQEKKNWEN